MTTTVRGAGRARHESNRRHQQTTPLPPRDGSQNATPAEVAANDASRAAEVKPDVCSLTGCGRRHKAGSAIAASHAEAAKRDQEVTVRPKAPATKPSVAEKPADAKSAGRSRPAKKASAAATTGAVPADQPGAPKAQRIIDAAGEAGWTGAWGLFPPSTIVVTCRREGETIVTTFTDGKLDLSAMPLYSAEGGRSVKLKNVSAVIAQMSGAKPTAKPVKPAGERAPRRTRAQVAESGSRPLPFDPKASSDEEVLDAIRGRAIEWMNGISRKVEEAVVSATRTVKNPKYKEGKSPKSEEFIDLPARVDIAPHPSRTTRVVTFADLEGTGFRSVALDRVTAVK